MSTKEVYLIIIDEVADYETVRSNISAYERYDSAKAAYDAFVEIARDEFAESEWEESWGGTFYEIYPEGNFAQSHFGVYLRTVEVC